MSKDAKTLRAMRELLAQGGPALYRRLRQMSPSQLADLIPLLSDEGRLSLVGHLDPEVAAKTLDFFDPTQQARILAVVPVHRIVRIVEHMTPDDVTDLVALLPPTKAKDLFDLMAKADAEEIRQLLSYPPRTAGGLMTPEYVSIPPHITVAEALEVLRREAPETESVYYIYVVDEDRVLQGVVSLRELLTANLDTPIRNVMRTHVECVHLQDDDEEVARKVARFDLLAIPVVDEAMRVHGVVTVDDIVDVLQEIRVAELMERVGSRAVELQRKSPWQVAALRLPWLAATIGIELVASLVVNTFSGTIQRFILLAAFMPVISAVAGNVGLQSSTVIVRGLETRLVRTESWWRSFAREIQTDLLIGLTAGTVLGTVAALWAHHVGMGVVVGVATLTAMMTAGFMGSVFPILSHSLGFDPAVTAGPFETSFQDVVGFFVFLGLATLLSRWLV